MAEQCLSNSIDTPSTLHLIKESTTLESRHTNSLIRRSLSNKLNILAVTPSTTLTTNSIPSTGSLATTRTDLGSLVQAVQRNQSVTNATGTITPTTATTPKDESPVCLIPTTKPFGSMTNFDACGLSGDSDDDSFDDEEEAVVAESLYSSLSSTVSNYAPMVCPICLESTTLQSSACCRFHCCSSCWRAHISASLAEGRIKILCASSECNKYLTRESIVNFIRHDSVLHERYLKLYTIANQNPRAKTCKLMYIFFPNSIILNDFIRSTLFTSLFT